MSNDELLEKNKIQNYNEIAENHVKNFLLEIVNRNDLTANQALTMLRTKLRNEHNIVIRSLAENLLLSKRFNNDKNVKFIQD